MEHNRVKTECKTAGSMNSIGGEKNETEVRKKEKENNYEKETRGKASGQRCGK